MILEFSGFPADAVKFLTQLNENNNREWFAANKSTYETAIKTPAEQFCDAMSSAVEAMTGVPHKAKIFRIYRDVRFSKDKTPYNTHLRISFTPETGGENRPAWYFGLEMDHIVLGVGLFGFSKTGLNRFRDLIIEEPGAKLEAHFERLRAASYRIGEPELKRIPSGYDKDHPRAELLRHKRVTVWKDYSDAKPVYTPGLVDECMSAFQDMNPVYDWLTKI